MTPVRLEHVGLVGWKVVWVWAPHLTASSGSENNQHCLLFAVLIAGKLLSCLDNSSAVPVLQVDPVLPLEANTAEEAGGDTPSVQSEPRRGPGRGRKAKGRRPGATAIANNGKGEKSSAVADKPKTCGGRNCRMYFILSFYKACNQSFTYYSL